MGIPLTKATLNAVGAASWRALNQRSAADWQVLPGTGEEKAQQVVNWLHAPPVDRAGKVAG